MNPIITIEQDGGFTVDGEEAILFTGLISKTWVDGELVAYDRTSSTSPSVTTTRVLPRALFDAVLDSRGDKG